MTILHFPVKTNVYLIDSRLARCLLHFCLMKKKQKKENKAIKFAREYERCEEFFTIYLSLRSAFRLDYKLFVIHEISETIELKELPILFSRIPKCLRKSWYPHRTY